MAGNAPQSMVETMRGMQAAWNVVTLEIVCARSARRCRSGGRIFDLGPLVDVVKKAAWA